MRTKFNRPDDFAHNNRPIRIRCYFCLLDGKSKNQSHVFKNLWGLSWHINQDHQDIRPDLHLEFNEVLKNISKALFWGIL